MCTQKTSACYAYVNGAGWNRVEASGVSKADGGRGPIRVQQRAMRVALDPACASLYISNMR